MNARRSISAAVVVLILVAVVASGCAKRPSIAAVAAPAPTGVSTGPALTAPPPAPVPAPVPAPTLTPPPPALAPGRSSTLPPEPTPEEFAPSPGLAAIHFDFDRSVIRKRDAQILDANAAWLKAHPRHLVLIEGHCDQRGTNEYNVALGDRRAAAARDYLVAHGIDAGRIKTVSYGEERPECRERTEPCWARNRQARFLTRPQ